MKRFFSSTLFIVVTILLAANLLNLALLRLSPGWTPLSWGVGAVLVILGNLSTQASGVRSETITRGYTPKADEHTERLQQERRGRELTGLYLALLGGSLLLANWWL